MPTIRPALASLGSCLLTAAFAAADPPSVVFVVGEGEYRSEWSMQALADLLEEEHGFETTFLLDDRLHGGPGNDIEGLEALEEADLAILYLRFRQLPDEQLRHLADYVERGGSIVGFRTTTHAFAYPDEDRRADRWNDFGADVLGAPWKYHYGHDSTTEVTLPEAIEGHPVLTDVAPTFDVRSWTYHVRDDFPPADAVVLAQGRPHRPDEGALGDETVNPVAWTWTRPDGGRTFTTTMGHPEDFGEPDFLRLVVNGIHWALELPAPTTGPGEFPAYRERTGQPWIDMDYGPFLSAAIEVDPENIACKGVAVPLNEDATIAALFDTAELRWAAGWEGNFVELRGIVYDGPHGTWPRIDGEPAWMNPPGPGIARPATTGPTNFEDPRDVPYGPLPRSHGRFQGLVPGEDGVVLRYSVGDAIVFERLSVDDRDDLLVWSREIEAVDVSTPLDLSLFEVDPEVALTDDDLEEMTLDAGDDPRRPVRPLNGRRCSVIERDGEVVGAIGWVDAETNANPRGSGNAMLFGGSSLQPERLTARIMPPPTGVGDGRFRLLFAELDESQLPAFLDRVAAADRGSDLQTIWNTGSPARWDEAIDLTGELDVRFDPREDDVQVVRFDHGGARVSLAGDEGSKPRLYGVDGTALDGTTRPLDDVVAAFEYVEGDPPAALAAWDFDEDSTPRMRNHATGRDDLRLDGVTWRRGVRGRSLDFDGTARAVWETAEGPDPADVPLTISAWIHTTRDGTILARTNPEGDWAPDGCTFFVRDGRLAWDVGWIGVVEGATVVADGAWHHVAVTVDPDAEEIVLWVDGEPDGIGEILPSEPRSDTAFTLGFTNHDFPATSRFSGYVDGVRIHDQVLDQAAIRRVAAESGEPLVTAHALDFEIPGTIEVVDDLVVATIEAETPFESIEGRIRNWRGPRSQLKRFIADRAHPGIPNEPSFVIDRITWPDDNPWDSWMRFGDFDFLDEGRAAAISTWSGDVWRVDGLDSDLQELSWRRIATGLSQPLGLATRDDEVLVVGRDQITRLVDLDGDLETDRYEAFNVDAMNSPHFHEPASGLQIGPDGDLHYIKAARHAKTASHPRHGTLIRVAADGSSSRIEAGGFRAPNGLAVDADGVAWSSDQEGHWMPANRINRIEPGSFHGNNWSGDRLDRSPRTVHDPPLLWIHPTVDRSPAAQLRVPEGVWGTLGGKLLGVSYGTGRVYLLLEDEIDGVHQGALVPLPIEVPTGLMRGRFHPDGSLYVAGLFGWSSDQTDPGGFYRVRRSDAPLPLPTLVRPIEGGLVIEFDHPIAESPVSPDDFDLSGWNYRWSSDYGSPQLDLETGEPGVTELPVVGAMVSDDRRTVRLEVPGMQPAMQMHLEWRLPFEGVGTRADFVHFTVHRLGDAAS